MNHMSKRKGEKMNLKVFGNEIIYWIKNPLGIFVFFWVFAECLKEYLDVYRV